jgi:hypothetical protein
MRSRYRVFGGRVDLGMNSKGLMSIKPKISGRCASAIFLRQLSVSFVRELIHRDFAFAWHKGGIQIVKEHIIDSRIKVLVMLLKCVDEVVKFVMWFLL